MNRTFTIQDAEGYREPYKGVSDDFPIVWFDKVVRYPNQVDAMREMLPGTAVLFVEPAEPGSLVGVHLQVIRPDGRPSTVMCHHFDAVVDERAEVLNVPAQS